MKASRCKRGFAPLIFIALFTLAGVSFADAPKDKPTAKDVSQKAADAALAIKDYSAAQRDEAIKKTKAALEELDARIERLENHVEKNWDKMDHETRKKASATLRKLRRERNEVAEWYGGLEHGSAEAWEEVKSGFLKSYKALHDSFARAAKDF
ncbi:MAG TPA: hypothetical protein VFB20_17635 [Burkholderiales bacterium]|nr:hypothetical protein [Burkholderiales bacterium]